MAGNTARLIGYCVLFGVGVAAASRAVDGLFGPRKVTVIDKPHGGSSSAAAAPASAGGFGGAAAAYGAPPAMGGAGAGGACRVEQLAFRKCMDAGQADCSYYHKALTQCQQQPH